MTQSALNFAISIRNKTIDEIGWYDPEMVAPKDRYMIIGFSESRQIAEGEDQYPSPPMWWEVIGYKLQAVKDRKSADRQAWYKAYRNYRIYLHTGDYPVS